MNRIIAVCVVGALATGCARQQAGAFPSRAMVDLSHSYDAQTIFWPTAADGFKLERVADGITPGGYESHRALYEHDVPAFENLTNLDRLPITGAHIIALPMK